MATKQIQLRGISRTPSDRLTNDGGCAESLNVQLDNTELAPSFYPDDVTTKRGLPADLEAERIFIHKTASYENYIVVQSDRVVAYTPQIEDEEPLKVIDLSEGETVSDIASVGNTLIISTSNNLYYVLYENRQYTFLGYKVPFPYIGFERVEIENIFPENGLELSRSSDEDPWFIDIQHDDFPAFIPTEKEWNSDASDTSEHTGKIRAFLENVWHFVYLLFTRAIKDGKMVVPVIIRYEVELWDGSVSSIPILIPSNTGEDLAWQIEASKQNIWTYIPGIPDPVTGNIGPGGWVNQRYHSEKVTVSGGMQSYKIFAKVIQQVDFMRWKEIVKSINIYMSKPLPFPWRKFASYLTSRFENSDENEAGDGHINYFSSSNGRIEFRQIDYKDEVLLNTAETFLIKKIDVFNESKNALSDDMESLINGEILDIQKYMDNTREDYQQLEGLDRIKDTDMKHYIQTADRISTYNNKLLLIQSSQLIDYDYARMNAYDKTSGDETEIIVSYDVTYVLRGDIEDKVVKRKFTYKTNQRQSETIYAFQIFPDSRAYKMLIKTTSSVKGGTEVVKYGEFDMLQNPYLDCAYYYGDINKKLIDLCNKEAQEELDANPKEDQGNKLIMSETDYSFVFPIQNRYTFQSKVLGVAIATTTLSQGQFGQFPLYVFTEDGIWVMETGADGSFVSQKPLSREVCINPDSITSLDNGVVFVTAQGVMLLQGSQVTNISPFMNGRHYTVEESAKNIINGQKDFKDFIPVVEDKTHFMAFVKEAKIAYDYAGRRLIFIKEGEDYQYIYKLDTQAWHKSAYGVKLIAPINSYPECLVMGEGEGEEKKYLKIISFAASNLNEFQLSEDFMLKFGDSYGLTEEQLIEVFTAGSYLDITQWTAAHTTQLKRYLETERVEYEIVPKSYKSTKVLDLSTVLDAAESKTPTKGVIATRPLDLGEPDVFKTITDIRVRGQYPKSAVKFILLGSNDGVTFYTINTLRGKAWKLFRIIILADLKPTDRISWIDVQYETKFTNKLR